MLDWIIENKEWVFSGVGVAIVTTIIGFLIKKQKPEPNNSIQNSRIQNSTVLQNSSIENLHIKNEPRKKGPSLLKIVDISLHEQKDKYPYIEIKLRNVGDSVAFIKKVIFDIKDVGAFMKVRDDRPCAVPISWNYDIKLSSEAGEYSYEISQVVPPDDVDRFTFTLAHSAGPLNAIFKIFLKIIYDEDDKEITTEPILINIPSSYDILGFTVGSNVNEYAINHNKDIYSRFEKYTGIMSEEYKKIFSAE